MTAVLEPSIAERLPSLSKDELRELSNRVNYLIDPSGSGRGTTVSADKDETDPDYRLVHGEFVAALKSVGDRHQIPLKVMLKSPTLGGLFRKGVPAFLGFIREEFKPKNQIETVKVIRLLFRCIVSDFKRRHIPIGPKTLSQGMERVSQVVENAFPSYIACGMLPMVLKRAE